MAPLNRGSTLVERTIPLVAIMATFMPDDTNDPCKPAGGGRGRVYYVNLTDATPVFDLNNSGNESALTADDISKVLGRFRVGSNPKYALKNLLARAMRFDRHVRRRID